MKKTEIELDVLKSLRTRINEAKKKIEHNKEDTTYQEQIIQECEALILKLR